MWEQSHLNALVDGRGRPSLHGEIVPENSLRGRWWSVRQGFAQGRLSTAFGFASLRSG